MLSSQLQLCGYCTEAPEHTGEESEFVGRTSYFVTYGPWCRAVTPDCSGCTVANTEPEPLREGRVQWVEGGGQKKPSFVLAGHSGSCLWSQHFVRLRWADHLKSGVRDQPGQHGETPSLLKIQKLGRLDTWLKSQNRHKQNEASGDDEDTDPPLAFVGTHTPDGIPGSAGPLPS
ncbi:hypothetical protein AAY473_031965 [Plecturocebus cupreus]